MKPIIRNALMLGLFWATAAVWAEKPHDRDGFGDTPGPQGGPDHKKHAEQMAQELDLTAEQREKARALRETRDELVKAQREKMRPLHEELRRLLEAEKVDLAAVRRQLETISKGHVEMRMQDIQGRLEFEALLTVAQKKKLKEIHKKKDERRRKS